MTRSYLCAWGGRYALGRADYRVHFAINSGSISGPPFVTIFR
jgi:hypothetical protein